VFFLYRHWTIYQGIAKSPYVISYLYYWRGKNKIQTLLAKVGISTAKADSPYEALEKDPKSLFHKNIIEVGLQFGLTDLTFETFIKYRPFKITAPDTVSALVALIGQGGDIVQIPKEENIDINTIEQKIEKLRKEHLRDNFWEAYASLRKPELLKKRLE